MICKISTSFEDLSFLNPRNHLRSFCDNYSLRSLIKQPTWYKSPTNPTCIDLILTNRPQSFQSNCVLDTGLSDFHLMTLTVMKNVFKKLKPRIINYRSYKHFSNEAFRKSLLNKLSNKVFVTNYDGLLRFCCINTVFPLISAGPQISAAPLGIHIEISVFL